MPSSPESRKTAAALCLLGVGLALLAAPSLLAWLRPPAQPSALEIALQQLEADRVNNPNPTGRPRLTAEMEAAFAKGPPGREPQATPRAVSTPQAAGPVVASGECRAVAAEIGQWLDHEDDRSNPGEARQKIEAVAAAGHACPELYIEQARLAMQSGGMYPDALNAAEAALRQGLQLDPQHGNTFVLLGFVLAHQSRLDEATAAFETARRFKADSPWLELNVGELLLGQGKIEEGLRHYQTAVDNPALPARIRGLATEAMARQFARDGRQAEARDAYEKLIAGGQDGAWTLGNYSRLLRTHMLDTPRSLEMGRRALAKKDYPWGRENLGATLYLAWAEALIKEKNSSKAEKLYAEARKYMADPGELLREVPDYPHTHPIVEALKAKGHSLDLFPGRSPGSGETPLTLAAIRRNPAVVEQLLAAGADPDRSGYEGTTALMHAARRGDTEVVRKLLQHDADPAIRDTAGKDAETIAREADQAEAAQLLAAARADRKPGTTTSKGVDAGGLPLVAYRYRALRAIKGVTLAGGVAQGEIVVFEGSRGRITDQGHDPNALWLNFRTPKGHQLQLEQWLDRLDWHKTFEFVAEP